MLCPVCVCLVALSFCSIQFSVAVLNLIHLNKINWIHQQQQHHHQKQKMASAIDTNSMTMTRYVIMEQRNVRDATGELTTLLNALQTGKRIFGMPKKKNWTGVQWNLLLLLMMLCWCTTIFSEQCLYKLPTKVVSSTSIIIITANNSLMKECQLT